MIPTAMDRPRFTTLIAWAVFAATASQGVRAQDDPLKDLAKAPLSGSVASEDMRSRALGRRARFSLYLPAGYHGDLDRRYEIVFLFHDLFENHDRWLTRGGPQMIEAGIAKGTIEPLIVCVPELGRGLCLDPVEGKKNAWRTFFVDELLPHVERKWRTRPGRAGRVLFGIGSGGYGALSLAFARPHLFSAVGAHAPMLPARTVDGLSAPHRKLMGHLFLEDAFKAAFGDPLQPEVWERHHPETLAKDLESSSGLRVLLETFPDEPRGFHAGGARLRDVLKARKIEHAYHERTGLSGWVSLREYLAPSLRFLVGTDETTGPPRNGRPSKEDRVDP